MSGAKPARLVGAGGNGEARTPAGRGVAQPGARKGSPRLS